MLLFKYTRDYQCYIEYEFSKRSTKIYVEVHIPLKPRGPSDIKQSNKTHKKDHWILKYDSRIIVKLFLEANSQFSQLHSFINI